MGRIAKAAAEKGHLVVDLTSSGWTPKPDKIEKLWETLEKLNLTEIDTVVIDPMSNSAYLGTDEDGLPIPVDKSDEDGRYHLLGNLQLAPPSAFKNCMKNMEKMLAFVGGAKVVFTTPLPRYVLSGCCKNTEHVSNRLSGELGRVRRRRKVSARSSRNRRKNRTGKNSKLVRIFWFWRVSTSGSDHRRRDEHLGGRRGTPDLQRQQSRRQKVDGGPGRQRRGGRAVKQESQTGVRCAVTRACEEEKRGNGPAANVAAQTGPATAAAMAIRPAATNPARKRIRARIRPPPL